MTIQTLDKTGSATEDEARGEATTAATVGKAPARPKAGRGPSTLAGALRRLAPGKGSGGSPVLIWAVFFRSVVLIADYLLASMTAMVVIPMLGAWLHRQSGAAGGDLTMAGTVAMWVAPLLFVVLLLAAAEIAAMRGMWRWSTRRIEAVREARVLAQAQVSTAPRTTRPSKKTNRKRSN
ncbi:MULTISPECIES: hypothetical protein [Paenarthrobacter]|uniref:ABC transmembrane type-1 domain-containing protein n=1 Tax=Paenarthrobacter ureafaciens TaxID=37931 RepID=A0AAX3EEB8_PAEUR|nr:MULTISPECIES: hypothetical protein [Paenarthrobacter]NKR13343.1 hypothetical protein [Arthrobacter sp. M5]NKR14807.1 hypothetical protein [Arthrobacter sp. M6]OEH62362.1 hypothetical protein A5N13_01500 [Arthrobacter sp. D4]OEH62933.1 hypothetical protein A5N17_09740 [Arthrobacter sp. D2]MDO5865104.1 hypothetical protein [Paenarthrobacter sp. SD-2]